MKRIRVTFGLTSSGSPVVRGVEKVVIHPQYASYRGNLDVGHTDVALIRVEGDVFEMEEEEISSSPHIVPICLPAKLGYRLEQSKIQGIQGIHQPFEDLDCFFIEGKIC